MTSMTYPKNRAHSVGPNILLVLLFLLFHFQRLLPHMVERGEHGCPCGGVWLLASQLNFKVVSLLEREEGREVERERERERGNGGREEQECFVLLTGDCLLLIVP